MSPITRAQGPDDRGPGGGPPPGPPGRIDPLLRALDTDRDGKLSSSEIQNASAALKALDKDNNGKLDRSEIRSDFGPGGSGGMRPGGNAMPADEMVKRYMSLDKDGDGKLSKAEVPAPCKDSLPARIPTLMASLQLKR